MAETLAPLLSLSVLIFAVSSMLSVGFSYTLNAILGPLRIVSAVIRALVANFVLVPLLAHFVVRFLALDEPLAAGLMLVAMAAGAPFLIRLATTAGGDVGLSATLLVLLLPTTVIYLLVVVPLAVPDATLSAGAIALPLLLSMLLPLALGLLVKALAARASHGNDRHGQGQDGKAGLCSGRSTRWPASCWQGMILPASTDPLFVGSGRWRYTGPEGQFAPFCPPAPPEQGGRTGNNEE